MGASRHKVRACLSFISFVVALIPSSGKCAQTTKTLRVAIQTFDGKIGLSRKDFESSYFKSDGPSSERIGKYLRARTVEPLLATLRRQRKTQVEACASSGHNIQFCYESNVVPLDMDMKELSAWSGLQADAASASRREYVALRAWFDQLTTEVLEPAFRKSGSTQETRLALADEAKRIELLTAMFRSRIEKRPNEKELVQLYKRVGL